MAGACRFRAAFNEGTNFAAICSMKGCARLPGESGMKARCFALVAVLGCVSLGGGVVALAAIGSALEDEANIAQPRFNATARCEDGTWSWSKNREAPDACAHHGGVALLDY